MKVALWGRRCRDGRLAPLQGMVVHVQHCRDGDSDIMEGTALQGRWCSEIAAERRYGTQREKMKIDASYFIAKWRQKQGLAPPIYFPHCQTEW